MHLFLTPFSSAVSSPAELINLPFIPKSCSSVQEVTHAAPRKGSVLLDWVMDALIPTPLFTVKCWVARLNVTGYTSFQTKTYIELLLFLLQWSL